jgi:hypothetical protein
LLKAKRVILVYVGDGTKSNEKKYMNLYIADYPLGRFSPF